MYNSALSCVNKTIEWAGTVVVTVKTRQGTPVAGILVTASPDNAPSYSTSITTDQNGGYDVGSGRARACIAEMDKGVGEQCAII